MERIRTPGAHAMTSTPHTPPDGVPCHHPGCLSHITHPCEGCGRIGGHPNVTYPFVFLDDTQRPWLIHMDSEDEGPWLYRWVEGIKGWTTARKATPGDMRWHAKRVSDTHAVLYSRTRPCAIPSQVKALTTGKGKSHAKHGSDNRNRDDITAPEPTVNAK